MTAGPNAVLVACDEEPPQPGGHRAPRSADVGWSAASAQDDRDDLAVARETPHRLRRELGASIGDARVVGVAPQRIKADEHVDLCGGKPAHRFPGLGAVAELQLVPGLILALAVESRSAGRCCALRMRKFWDRAARAGPAGQDMAVLPCARSQIVDDLSVLVGEGDAGERVGEGVGVALGGRAPAGTDVLVGLP